MRITGVGQGYVGLVTAAGAAEWGHDVIGVEIDPRRLEALRTGLSPIYEPGLAELIAAHAETGRLVFTDETARAVADAAIVLVAVPTCDPDGRWDSQIMRRCLADVVPAMADDGVLVIRSTCPPQLVAQLPDYVEQLRLQAGRPPVAFYLNPEFTREGNAVHDFLVPDRVVLGVVSDPRGLGETILRQFYAPVEAPILVLDAMDAVLAKLGSNLFLATKISFANELATLCDLHGARIERVVEGMSYDPRIGGSFLRAGIGFGGSCLPHQVKMTVSDADSMGMSMPLLAAVETINDRQRIAFVDRLDRLVGGIEGRRVALLGLTFKPHTDDLRAAPGIDIARELLARGTTVLAYDPMPAARANAALAVDGLRVVDSVEEAVTGADAIGLVTEWPEFMTLPWDEIGGLVERRIVVDGRNALDPEVLAEAGFVYSAFGRGLRAPAGSPATEPIGVMDHRESLLGRVLAIGEG